MLENSTFCGCCRGRCHRTSTRAAPPAVLHPDRSTPWSGPVARETRAVSHPNRAPALAQPPPISSTPCQCGRVRRAEPAVAVASRLCASRRAVHPAPGSSPRDGRGNDRSRPHPTAPWRFRHRTAPHAPQLQSVFLSAHQSTAAWSILSDWFQVVLASRRRGMTKVWPSVAPAILALSYRCSGED